METGKFVDWAKSVETDLEKGGEDSKLCPKCNCNPCQCKNRICPKCGCSPCECNGKPHNVQPQYKQGGYHQSGYSKTEQSYKKYGYKQGGYKRRGVDKGLSGITDLAKATPFDHDVIYADKIKPNASVSEKKNARASRKAGMSANSEYTHHTDNVVNSNAAYKQKHGKGVNEGKGAADRQLTTTETNHTGYGPSTFKTRHKTAQSFWKETRGTNKTKEPHRDAYGWANGEQAGLPKSMNKANRQELLRDVPEMQTLMERTEGKDYNKKTKTTPTVSTTYVPKKVKKGLAGLMDLAKGYRG